MYIPVNLIHQSFAVIFMYLLMNINFLYFYTLTRHILLELDLIIELCTKIGYFGIPSKRTNQFLRSKNDQKSETHNFLNIVLERHLKIMNVISIASDFYSINFLLWEALTFCSAVYSYYSIVIHQGQYSMLMGPAMVLSQYFMLCLLGANIMEKTSEIGKALYTSKWYELEDNEKKIILNIIQMSQKPCSLSAGGFGFVTLIRFNTVRNSFTLKILRMHI